MKETFTKHTLKVYLIVAFLLVSCLAGMHLSLNDESGVIFVNLLGLMIVLFVFSVLALTNPIKVTLSIAKLELETRVSLASDTNEYTEGSQHLFIGKYYVMSTALMNEFVISKKSINSIEEDDSKTSRKIYIQTSLRNKPYQFVSKNPTTKNEDYLKLKEWLSNESNETVLLNEDGVSHADIWNGFTGESDLMSKGTKRNVMIYRIIFFIIAIICAVSLFM